MSQKDSQVAERFSLSAPTLVSYSSDLLLLVPCGLARWMLGQNGVTEQNVFVRFTWNLNVLVNYFWSNSWHTIERNSTKQITQCCSNFYVVGETHKYSVSFRTLFWRGFSRWGGGGYKVPVNAGPEIRLSACSLNFFERAHTVLFYENVFGNARLVECLKVQFIYCWWCNFAQQKTPVFHQALRAQLDISLNKSTIHNY